MDGRGGTITMNFYRADGSAIDHRVIEEQANLSGISLRTGCFCNPGGGEIALNLSASELDTCFRLPGHQDRLTVDDFRLCIDGKSTGAVRVSLGLVSNFADVYDFAQFAMGLVDL
jgi:selenocysteine lyase/cysteine desulfurase